MKNSQRETPIPCHSSTFLSEKMKVERIIDPDALFHQEIHDIMSSMKLRLNIYALPK